MIHEILLSILQVYWQKVNQS